jgi:hypothetical protein
LVAHAARMGKMRNAFWLRSLSGADHSEDRGAVLYVHHTEIRFGGVYWIHLAQN